MSPFILFAALVAGVSANPSGPPLGVCGSLTPAGHAASTNNKDPVPYNITISEEMYGPMSNIQVTLQQTAAGNDFKGFILQARRTSGNMDDVLGTFTGTPPAGTQLLACPQGSTLAHNNNSDKQSVMMQWMAPNAGEGTLRFRATVVVVNSGAYAGQSTYYENIMSNDLVYDGPTSAPGTDSMMTTGGSSASILKASMLTMVTFLISSLMVQHL